MIRLAPNALLLRMLVDRLVVVAHVIQPIDDIFAAITPRGARGAAHAQMDAPAQVQVLGDLAAGLAGTDHHDISGRQQLGIFVVGGMDLVDLRRNPLGHARNGGILVAAGGHDHLVGGENTQIARDFEGLGIVPLQPRDRHPFVDGWSERLRVRFDVCNDLILHHKSVRIGPGVRMARELALPIRRDQTKGVPSLRAPGFCESVLFEDDVVDSPLLQEVAGRESRLSAADHDDGEMLLRRRGNGRFHNSLMVRTRGGDVV